ncbi:DUF1911 domain-containing protein [Curtobacterium sp. MCLR17_036]|uniref:PoNe immunity protein domain-containing protein n=1 Tax=Curtobacterium sp. MCLR17_036 TaxID=2175620 RepID=UPI000DA94F04|nr:PoNe immunity protein domain-containing protein [Curtobacterium sp. MCLR17_036]WIE65759.1 DUF1911 domain-containing protein [Curtobacterium sp. MCLR17_036]
MQPRDRRVSAAYWEDALRLLSRDVEQFRPFSHAFRSDDVRAGIMRTTANFESAIFLLGARYSAGVPVAALAVDVESVVTVWETWNRYAAAPDAGFPLDPLEFDNKSTYYNALWLASVARCVGVDPVLLGRLVGVVAAAGGADPVLGVLLGVEPVRDSVWHKRPFQNLLTAAEGEPARAEAALLRYVQAWEKNISFIWWAPALQAVQGDRFETYFGYWAWEAAGLVVARGLDDTALRSAPYYPVDLSVVP